MSDKPCIVLIVDDYKDCADTAARILAAEGHEVHVAYSASEALSKATAHCPDVVVMDIGLPGRTGIDLAKEIRQSCPTCRIVAVTGFTQEEIRRKSEEAGFNGYLLKPAEPEAINGLVMEQCTESKKAG